MKIAHITAVDGSLRYLLLNQMQAIQSHGFEVVGISSPGSNVSHIEAAGVRHIGIEIPRKIRPYHDLRALIELVRVFRRERFDLVHTHTPKPGLLGQLAARFAGVPLVVNTLHGFYFSDETPSAARRLFILVEKIAAKCSDRILSQNPEDIQTAIRLGIAPESILFELGNGVELSRFQRESIADGVTAGLREELGLDVGPVIGFVGRCVREKGLVELLDAFKIVRETLPAAQLVCVGRIDNDRGDAIDTQYAEQMGLGDAVHFLGLRQDIPELLTLMDVLALPSHREGFPRAPMEAAAMGIPSVVTDIRGCRQSVQHGETGLLVPLRDPTSLASALLRILNDASYAAELGRRAANYARQEFDEQRVFQRVVDCYRQLCECKGIPFPAVS